MTTLAPSRHPNSPLSLQTIKTISCTEVSTFCWTLSSPGETPGTQHLISLTRRPWCHTKSCPKTVYELFQPSPSSLTHRHLPHFHQFISIFKYDMSLTSRDISASKSLTPDIFTEPPSFSNFTNNLRLSSKRPIFVVDTVPGQTSKAKPPGCWNFCSGSFHQLHTLLLTLPHQPMNGSSKIFLVQKPLNSNPLPIKHNICQPWSVLAASWAYMYPMHPIFS